jgi:ubiquinol-cytochrome c reductase cytochrome c subunit
MSSQVHIRIATVILAALVILGMCGALFAQQQPKGNAENGKRLFTAYACYQCHGYLGQGSNAGARIAPKPLALAAMLKYIRKPTGVMPPVTAKVVSDAEVADIHAYLETIPAPPDVKTIKLLNQ